MFSKSTEYALRASIYIAQNASYEKKASIQSIAKGINAPKPFTAKIMQLLANKQNSIVVSIPGPSGGFYMTEEAKDLPVFEVIKAMNDSHIVESCLLGISDCSDEKPCQIHFEYKGIKMMLLALLKQKTIRELAEK